MAEVTVCEVFDSIQGESTYAGLPCFFIRLSGCNLRCRYCDTPHSYGAGRRRSVAALVKLCRASRSPLVEITGGEPLLQAGFAELARALQARSGKKVLVETNGSRDISAVPEGVVVVMDVKCPGSGEAAALDAANLGRLRPYDEVKFVLTDQADYRWASRFVRKHKLIGRCHAVLFSPAFGRLEASRLAEWILRDGLAVRLQVQLHRLAGVK